MTGTLLTITAVASWCAIGAVLTFALHETAQVWKAQAGQPDDWINDAIISAIWPGLIWKHLQIRRKR